MAPAFVLGTASADTAPVNGLPATASADALPTEQINGVAWAQLVVGNTVYVTGSFSQARPAGVAVGGAGSVARSNLLSYNITTGTLITSFNHRLNAQGRALAVSPNGSTLFVGGDFTTVDGVTHNRVAAFSTATGNLISSFTASMNSSVRALTASTSTLYLGGSFSTANGSSRSRLASFTLAGGLLGWNPGANATVYSMTLTPDKTRLVVGGGFTTLAGAPAVGMGAVDASTGASRPWAANTVIKDGGNSTYIISLSADANRVYGSGIYVLGDGNFEGRFAADPTTGRIQFMNPCHGDTYSVFPIGSVLYSAGHEHDCSDIGAFSQDNSNVFAATHHFVAAEMTTPNGNVARYPLYSPANGVVFPTYFSFAGQPVATQLDWYPTLTAGTYTGQSQAAWTVAGNATYVAVGGEFPTVNGTAQQGLVRFALSATAPNKVGPTAASSLTPKVYSQSPGTARVAWQTTWDRDNTRLTYRLFRDNATTPVYQTTVDTTFANRPSIGFVDTGLAVGSTHSYKVSATDPFNNAITSGSTSVTVGSLAASDYTSAVLADGATHFWPLSESSGTTAADQAGYADVTLAGAISLGTPSGPISGSTDTTATFGGGETTTGGSPNSPPTTTPHDTAGTVGNFVTSGDFSEEAWFKTTSTEGGGIVGEGLFSHADSVAVDKVVYMDTSGHLHFGVQDNSNRSTVDGAQAYNDGQWHLVDATFTAGTAKLYVDGTLIASASGLVDNIGFPGYWRIGGDSLYAWTSAPPGNYLSAAIGDVAVYPAALASSSIAAHFAFGSGNPPVNQPPIASFVASCTGLTCSVDGSASHDPDGTIVSYAWTFGDGGTATGVTASHTFAAGTYEITLTVTDNDSASRATSQSVTVSGGGGGGGPVVFADDEFDRSVSGGFGTAAPTGGAWTSTNRAASLSVTPGSGTITLAAGQQAGAYLGSVSTSGADIVTSFALNRLPVAGSGSYLYVIGRRVSATEQYLARVKVLPTGQASIVLSKYDGSATEVGLDTAVNVGTVSAGTVVHLHAQASGVSPTTVRAKAWIGAASEPAGWTVSLTDSSSALQSPGAVGVQAFLGSATTNGPIIATIPTLTVTAP